MRTTYDTPESLLVPKSFISQLHLPVLQRYSRWWMTFLLGTSDLLCLCFAGVLAVSFRSAIGDGIYMPERYLSLTPLLIAFLGIYAWSGLYPAVGLSPVEELRRLSISTSVVFLLVTAFTFWVRTSEIYSRIVFALTWIFALVFVQAGRWLVRIIMVRLGVWGEPVAVVGYGPQGQKIGKFLKRNLRFGLRPIVIVDGFDTSYDYNTDLPILLLGDSEAAAKPLQLAGIRTAVLITSEMPDYLQREIVDRNPFGFKRLILISDLRWIGSGGVTPHDLGGYVGLEIRQNLLNLHQQIFKRCLDLMFVVSGGILAFPLLAFIAILIRLDSPGKIFYHQERVGRGGHKFKMWKFRTMVQNADQILQAYLEKDPMLRTEWETTQKLKNDPRITRVGKILRKLSLDELPQIYNILLGEMSLVGPRPFFPDQLPIYGNGYHLYKQVRPGITGMWQVSGRNETTFTERTQWDEYYVRNWSIWLDIYILIRTLWVLLRSEGAY